MNDLKEKMERYYWRGYEIGREQAAFLINLLIASRLLLNKEERLLVPPLLRTVRETFASYGSSILSPFSRAAVICHGHSIRFADCLYVVQYFKCLICYFLETLFHFS